MGFLTHALGSGANDYHASNVPLLQGATVDQANEQYRQGQGLTNQQQQLADTLSTRAQSGTPIDFSGVQGSLGSADQVLAQLMATGQGQGSNPALEQLKQTTGQNIQQATGLVASQKGVNPAMAARTAAMTAANANQGAAGQAATLAAQQQLAATQQAGGLATTLAGQRASMAQAQAAQQAQNTGLLQQQQSTMGGLNLQQQQLLQQALAQYNSTNVQQNMGRQQINAGVAAQNAQIGSQMFGGIMGAAGAALGAGALMSDERVKTDIVRHGDEVMEGVPRATFEYRGDPSHTEYEGVIAQDVEKEHPELVGRTAEGIRTVPPALGPVPVRDEQPRKRTDKELAKEALEKVGKTRSEKAAKGQSDKEIAAQAMMHRLFGSAAPALARGGVAPAPQRLADGGMSMLSGMLSGFGQGSGGGGGDEKDSRVAFQAFQAPQPYARFARGGSAPLFFSRGSPEVVPGRATVAQGVDSEAADRVPALLTPGEGVLPRSVMQAPDAPEKAKDFVEHLVRTRRPAGRAKAAFGARRAER